MEFPATFNDQAAFDQAIGPRLARETTKQTELQQQLDQAVADKATAEQAATAAVQRAETAEGKVTEFETTAQVETWRTEVATATGVPAAALRGATKEDFEAHAAALKPLITGTSPVITSQGDQPTSPAEPADQQERAAVRTLFGGGETD